MKISMRDFIEFQKLLHDDKKMKKGNILLLLLLTPRELFILNSSRFPEYSYTAWFSLLTTKHIVRQVQCTEKKSTIMDRFLSRLPPSIRTKIQIVRNQKFIISQGKYYDVSQKSVRSGT